MFLMTSTNFDFIVHYISNFFLFSIFALSNEIFRGLNFGF